MSEVFRLNVSDVERLQDAMKAFDGNVEEAINDVLHNEAGEKIQESIRRLMPESGKNWKGKSSPAKTSNSMEAVNGNLYITIRSTKRYQYLYFPDDGSSTRRHAGNQQFFAKGAEEVKDEIIDRCITKLTNNF